MLYRKFKADFLFTGTALKPKGQVLITDERGTIVDIQPEAVAGEDVESYSGILVPGLINCHCHLELSHLKDIIPPHTGLIEFLCSVVQKRAFPAEIVQEAIQKAEQEMFMNGIVAVGDISNTTDALQVKKKSLIYWYNFIEVLSFSDERALASLDQYRAVWEAHQLELAPPHHQCLSPHAPYSISPASFKLINEASAGEIISMHNQEHPAEDELYRNGGGEFLRLFRIFGLEKSPFPVTGKSSIESWLPYFNKTQTILLVHNTYMPEPDMYFANAFAAEKGLILIYCICANANLYIENRMPPLQQFINNNCFIVLGTDSYSSNWQLDIIKEMLAIQEHFPRVALEQMLQWATINGAVALGMADKLGSFEKGKTPGIVLINQIENGRLTDQSVSKRIL